MDQRSKKNEITWIMLIILSNITPVVFSAADKSGGLRSGQKRPFDQSTQDDNANVERSADTSEASCGEPLAKKSQSIIGTGCTYDEDLECLGRLLLSRYYPKWFFVQQAYTVVTDFVDAHSEDQDVRDSLQLRRRLFRRSVDSVEAIKLDKLEKSHDELQEYEAEFRERSGFALEVDTLTHDIDGLAERTEKDERGPVRENFVELATDALSLIRTCRPKLEQMVSEYFKINPERMSAFIIEQINSLIVSKKTKEENVNANVEYKNWQHILR